MTYSADTDTDLAFGKTNVDKWADVNNNADAGEITARRLWAREQAYDELNSRLATSPYQFPLGGSTFPAIVVRMEAYLTGLLLYESRGITDVGQDAERVHSLAWCKKRVDEFVRDVHARRIKLLGATLADGAIAEVDQTSTMDFVSFDDPSPNRPVPTLGDDLIFIPPQG